MLTSSMEMEADEQQQEKEGISGGNRKRKVLLLMSWLKPYAICILLGICSAGFNVISKVSLDTGMSSYVLVVYGCIIGTFTTALFALLFERKKESIKISMVMLKDVFLLGVLGIVVARTSFYLGLKHTSPTAAAALANLLPSMTFILAVLYRMEPLDMSKRSAQAKVGGTLVALAGATIMILYKGRVVFSPHFSAIPSHHSKTSNLALNKDWVIGSLLIMLAYLSAAAFFLLQSTTGKKYPAPMTLTSLTCLSGTIVSTIIAAALDHKASSWRLSWDINLVAVLYTGIVIYGLTLYLQLSVAKTKGAVFLTAFRPLTTVFTILMGLLILGDALFLGSREREKDHRIIRSIALHRMSTSLKMEADHEQKQQQEKEGESGRKMKVMNWLKPYAICIFLNICSAGLNIISKASLNNGMSSYVLVVYGCIVGTLTTAFFALLFERTVLARTPFYLGLKDTSPTAAAALANLLPSITFILAVLCRMEALDIGKRSAQAKVGGTLVALAGATLMILYKGSVVFSPHFSAIPSHHSKTSSPSKVSSNNRIGLKALFSSLLPTFLELHIIFYRDMGKKEKDITILCYWNGNIVEGLEGLCYDQPPNKAIKVKYPSVVGPVLKYIAIPIKDDDDVDIMFDALTKHDELSNIDLYLETEILSSDIGYASNQGEINSGVSHYQNRNEMDVDNVGGSIDWDAVPSMTNAEDTNYLSQNAMMNNNMLDEDDINEELDFGNMLDEEEDREDSFGGNDTAQLRMPSQDAIEEEHETIPNSHDQTLHEVPSSSFTNLEGVDNAMVEHGDAVKGQIVVFNWQNIAI
ncbi:Drug/metabolite transporter [Corchorus olitorius]|uniref:Drug/metabolite transporter n=1 Tax=Corchorus olitorius TaxID=93759 RepID=A0A1R3J2B8_9ROSI|nr:Drug/metabolite transporter [Corchorus olitorius]